MSYFTSPDANVNKYIFTPKHTFGMVFACAALPKRKGVQFVSGQTCAPKAQPSPDLRLFAKTIQLTSASCARGLLEQAWLTRWACQSVPREAIHQCHRGLIMRLTGGMRVCIIAGNGCCRPQKDRDDDNFLPDIPRIGLQGARRSVLPLQRCAGVSGRGLS